MNNENQKIIAQTYLTNLIGLYDSQIHTKILEEKENGFISISKDKHNFYLKNPTDGYCISIINPKLDKLRVNFKSLIKPI